MGTGISQQKIYAVTPTAGGEDRSTDLSCRKRDKQCDHRRTANRTFRKKSKRSWIDAVEVHGAHGYLIGAFASPFSNKRSDEYGGTIRNRARFAMEIIENIKEKCGKDYPVLYRMSAVKYVPGGLEIEES